MNYVNKYTVIGSMLFIICIGVLLFSNIRPQITYQSEFLDVYFLPGSLNPVFETISSANTSVQCLLRSLNYPELEELLFEKERSDISVRLLIDADYSTNPSLFKPFIKFVDLHPGLLHSNFCVIDSEIVLTGSLIYNKNTLHRNIHDLLVIRNVSIAKAFESHFWKIESETFTGVTTSHVKNFFEPAESGITPYFCMYDDCLQVLVSELARSSSIAFATYALTHSEVIALLDANTAKGFVDMQGITPQSCIWKHSCLMFDSRYVLHTKIFILDDTVITGTVNPSNSAFEVNDETMVVIKDPLIVEVYRSFFRTLQ